MENLALRMRARHGHELPRSVEPHGFVPQGSEVPEIPAGSTTKIKDGIRRVALYCVEECRVVLVDIVVSRAVPESPGKSIVIRDRRIREAPDLFRVILSRGAAHRPPMFSIAGDGIKLFGPFCHGVLSRSRAARDLLKSSATPAPRRPEISIAGVSRRAAVPALSPAAGCAIPTGSPTPASSPTTAAPATQSVSRREFVTWGSSAALPFRPRFRDLRL